LSAALLTFGLGVLDRLLRFAGVAWRAKRNRMRS